MATIAPAITISSTPGLSVTTGIPGMSYQNILNDIGVVVYYVNEIYLYSSNISQLLAPIQYGVFESNGNILSYQIINPYNPQQYQPTIVIDVSKQAVIIDSETGFAFNMLPGIEMQFLFYMGVVKNQDGIDAAGQVNNMKQVQSALGYDFFNRKEAIE